jgi:hypothetical protein
MAFQQIDEITVRGSDDIGCFSSRKEYFFALRIEQLKSTPVS